MPKPTAADGLCHQFAALPWREANGTRQILMITSRQSRHWLIPKGWPMTGKTNPEAAAQEAFEEAGVRGSISEIAVGDYEYDKLRPSGEALHCRVSVFPLRVCDEHEDWPEAKARERRWVDIQEAAELAFEPGLCELLRGLDDESAFETIDGADKDGQ